MTSMVEQVVLQSDEESSPSDSADAAPAAAPESEPVEAAVQDEPEPEREAPPVPEEGLPNGWTMDQWKWYGHQWLEQNK